MTWTQEEALRLCRQIEAICPDYGCHVKLTGGLLYKDGPRKDADILFYRIRQEPEINIEGLMVALVDLDVIAGEDFGWCHKATYQGKPIDFFFPDRDGDYPTADPDDRPIYEPILSEYIA